MELDLLVVVGDGHVLVSKVVGLCPPSQLTFLGALPYNKPPVANLEIE